MKRAELVLLLVLLQLFTQGCSDRNASDKKDIWPSDEHQEVAKSRATLVSQQPSRLLYAEEKNSLTQHESTVSITKEVELPKFTVKEAAAVGAENYPTLMVFPLAYGTYYDEKYFHIRDDKGNLVPAQFEVLNRWWGKDQSLRHVVAHFATTVEPYQFGSPTTGIAQYTLFRGQENPIPTNPVQIREKDDLINIGNGVYEVSIVKSPFQIKTPAGSLNALFTRKNGVQVSSFERDDIVIEVEESGPIRAVVKISSKTQYKSSENIEHGWALRLYAYANSTLLKVDYQLQNSALDTPNGFSAPMYFKGVKLQLDDADVLKPFSLRADKIPVSNIQNLPLGAVSSGKVSVFLRNFWQTFPNGLSSNENNKIDIELWPEWSKQFYDDAFVRPNIYWLDDMKHTYKEVLLDFGSEKSRSKLNALAKTFQYSPIAVVPHDYIRKAAVTTDLGGLLPRIKVKQSKTRIPQYDDHYYDPKSFSGYRFGMDNFGLDTARKRATAMQGGWPYSTRQFWVTGNPADFYNSQDFAAAELNVRPQWLAGYVFERDYEKLKLTNNPYGGVTWRKFENDKRGNQTINRPYIYQTKRTAKPRDYQHGWFYHVEHAYLMSANKWIKDWYEFMAEFQKTYLYELDPYPDSTLRAEGHAVGVALSAYQMTGNKALADSLKNYYKDIHQKYLVPPFNLKSHHTGKHAAFQVGYATRTMINVFTEFPEEKYLLDLMGNYFEWNYKYSNFSYYKSITEDKVATKASGAGMSLVEPAIWYGLYTAQKKYVEHSVNFVENGIGGQKAYGDWNEWSGQYESPVYLYSKQMTH